MKEALDVTPELIKGSGGIFEVAVGGRVVARKSASGFPTESEMVASVRGT